MSSSREVAASSLLISRVSEVSGVCDDSEMRWVNGPGIMGCGMYKRWREMGDGPLDQGGQVVHVAPSHVACGDGSAAACKGTRW